MDKSSMTRVKLRFTNMKHGIFRREVAPLY
jgi:hypothetical protein